MQEKEEMLRYVVEEVDRVKGLFEDKAGAADSRARHSAARRA